MRQEGFEEKAKRDEMYKTLKKEGKYNLRKWVLKNQEVGYTGFGTERNLTHHNVYMLDIVEIE